MENNRPSVTEVDFVCEGCGALTSFHVTEFERTHGISIKSWCEVCGRMTEKQEVKYGANI